MQGGLPTFLDIGSSFSAATLHEDSLLHQLLQRNQRMVRVGQGEAGGLPSFCIPFAVSRLSMLPLNPSWLEWLLQLA
jgi:hypothetical protein